MKNLNKAEKELFDQCKEKYLEEKNLKSVRLTNDIVKEIIRAGHDRYGLVNTVPSHQLHDKILTKAGEYIETFEEKETKAEIKRKVKAKKSRKEMKAAIKKRFDEEMKKEMEYYKLNEEEEEEVPKKIEPKEILKPVDIKVSDTKIEVIEEEDEDEEVSNSTVLEELAEDVKESKLDIDDLLDSI